MLSLGEIFTVKMSHIVFRALPIAPSKEPEGQQLGFHTVHRQKLTMFSKMLC